MIEARERLESVITLKQVLLETTIKPDRVYEGPDVIDLDSLQQDVEDLIDFTLSHPNNYEAARIIYLDRNNKLITNKNIIQGVEEGRVKRLTVIGELDIEGLPRLLKQDRFVASDIHSHPIDSVFSTDDLIHLLKKDEESDCATSALLITPYRKLLALRGRDTPSWENPGAVMMNINDEIISSANKKNKFWTRNKSKQRIRLAQNQEMFGLFAQTYDLQLFEGGVRDRFLQRKDPGDIAS